MKLITDYKVIVIGSGPAGCTAAMYLSRANLAPLVLEGLQPGGQLTITTDVENYPGFPEGILGPKLMDLMRQQAERFGAVFKMEQVEKVELRTHPYTVTTRSEEHTSELQSLRHLVCRLLLEKKKKIKKTNTQTSQYRQIKQHA